jgi:hypothetical protein
MLLACLRGAAMTTLIWGLIGLNLVLTAWFVRRHLQLRREVDAARKQVAQWAAEGIGAAVSATMAALNRPALISVEVLNPLELAARESRLAKTFGALTPDLVQREVYKQVYERMCKQLQEQGVVADVRLHHAAA